MLKGNSVTLRPVERKDIHIIYDMLCDEQVRHLDGGFNLPPSKEYLLENFNQYVNLAKKYLSIINEKGVLVGYMTYKELTDTCNVFSVGVTVARNFWNRGYGSDSMKTLIKYLFMNKGAQRIELEVLGFNERAIRCYSKCGFIEEGRKRNRYFSQGKYCDVVIMGIIKSDFFDEKSI